MGDNTFKVPRSQWKKWSSIAKTIFENLFEMMDSNAHLFQHPDAPELSGKEWRTTAWNAAWMAADLADDEVEQLRKALK